MINQDYPNWEFIIVDDASTDASFAVCDSFSKKDSRIKVYTHKTNKGVSAARNTGLKYSTGDYILFLDSDDRFSENALSILFSSCSSINPDILVFGCRNGWIPNEIICNWLLEKEFIQKIVLSQHINICKHTEFFLQPYVWNKCFRRELIFENDIVFEEKKRVWEDNTFLIQCFDNCKYMYIIQDVLYILGDYPNLDHLSSHVDETVILQYIEGYKDNLCKFGDRYDFQNDYTPRRYFEVINDQLRQLCLKIETDAFMKLLTILINDEVVLNWASKINPKDKIEIELKEAYLAKNVIELCRVYQNADAKKQKSSRKNSRIVSWIRRHITK